MIAFPPGLPFSEDDIKIMLEITKDMNHGLFEHLLKPPEPDIPISLRDNIQLEWDW